MHLSSRLVVVSHASVTFWMLALCVGLGTRAWTVDLHQRGLSSYHSLDYGKYYHANVTKGNISTFIYDGNSTYGVAVRINAQALNASKKFPVMFVVKDQMSILSWQMPLLVEGHSVYDFYNVCRTLCPRFNSTLSDMSIQMDVSTFSPTPVPITISADLINVDLALEKTASVLITPSEPAYFRYTFLPNQDRVRVLVSSPNMYCGILSIQDAECPVYDDARSITFEGKYQTISTKGAIAVQRADFGDSFFVVLSVNPSDYECTATGGATPFINITDGDRLKNMTVEVLPTATKDEYVAGTFGLVGIFLLVYIAAFALHCATSSRVTMLPVPDGLSLDDGGTSLLDPCSSEDERSPIHTRAATANYGATSSSGPGEGQANSAPTDHLSQSSSLDLHDVDLLTDIEEEKDVFRTKTFLFVSDLSRKSPRRLRKRYNLYTWNLLTLAIFYGLPVIQLVITYQKVLNDSGNEDVCYYNFYCAFPLGPFSAFNNIFSNIGYVMLGALFIILVYLRHRQYRKRVAEDCRYAKEYGIPQYFGLFYAMGLALMMEGVLSACYHVCPNTSNYQFDTAFMYMIGWLSMLKIYQIRHPDVNAQSHVAYFAIAVLIFLGVIGVVKGTKVYWGLFAGVYMLAVVMLSVHIYYMGRWKLNLGLFKRLYLLVRSDRFFCLRPTYLDRFVLLLFAVLINWTIAVLGVVFYPTFRDFASYLLAIVIINLFLYLGFYIIMKLRSGERLRPAPLLLSLAACVVWGFALYFFISRLTSWQVTPAMSREGNRKCIVVSFYDDHDVWHCLSAMGLFLSFTATLFLDDDLDSKRRDTIPVF